MDVVITKSFEVMELKHSIDGFLCAAMSTGKRGD